MKILSTALFLCGMLLSTSAQPQIDCPKIPADPNIALQALRDGIRDQPDSTAACFARNVLGNVIPNDKSQPPIWLTYIREGGDFLRRKYDSSPKPSNASIQYLESEIVARTQLRDRVGGMLGDPKWISIQNQLQTLRNEYVRSVADLTDAIWFASMQRDSYLEKIDSLLIELDPMYLGGGAATRWIEAVRSCPQWVPDNKQPIPDYKTKWCTTSCRSKFDSMYNRLKKDWLDSQLYDSGSRAKLLIESRKSEVSNYCGV